MKYVHKNGHSLTGYVDNNQVLMTRFDKRCVKKSVFGVSLVRMFQWLDWIRENVDQNNSEYGHFLCSENHQPISQITDLKKLGRDFEN